MVTDGFEKLADEPILRPIGHADFSALLANSN